MIIRNVLRLTLNGLLVELCKGHERISIHPKMLIDETTISQNVIPV